MTNILIKLRNSIMYILGHIKVSPFPMFLIFQPKCYNLKGQDAFNIMNNVKSGDVILRGYNSFISSMIIGKWSHVGLVAHDNKVIHSIARGVCEEHILQFCKADRVCIMRALGVDDYEINSVINKAKSFIGTKYDYGFDAVGDNHLDELYCSELIFESFNLNDLHKRLGMFKKSKRYIFGLVKKTIIEPVDFKDSFEGFEVISSIVDT